MEVVDEAQAGSAQDVEAEVAAPFVPFVVLLGQDGADESEEAGAVGKIPTTSVRRQISRMRRSPEVVGPDQSAGAALLGHYVQVPHMPETDKLWNTICQWWAEIEVLIVTGGADARTEAANTSIKNIKRTGPGFRNPADYKARIVLCSTAKTAA